MDQRRMTSVEIQAYSVDEAVRLALEQLGLGGQDVDIEILSDAGPDEGDEALVRVTAKGMASQPIPRAAHAAQSVGSRAGAHGQGPGRERRQPGVRRVPGDRPSSRGAPPRERPRAPVTERARDVDRVDEAEEQVAKEIVRGPYSSRSWDRISAWSAVGGAIISPKGSSGAGSSPAGASRAGPAGGWT